MKQTVTSVSSDCLSNGAQSGYQTTNKLVSHDRDHASNELTTNFVSFVATSAAISSSFGRVSLLSGATRVLAMSL